MSSIYEFVKEQRNNYRSFLIEITEGYEYRSTKRCAPSSCTTTASLRPATKTPQKGKAVLQGSPLAPGGSIGKLVAIYRAVRGKQWMTISPA
jgi:hypothetical protein